MPKYFQNVLNRDHRVSTYYYTTYHNMISGTNISSCKHNKYISSN